MRDAYTADPHFYIRECRLPGFDRSPTSLNGWHPQGTEREKVRRLFAQPKNRDASHTTRPSQQDRKPATQNVRFSRCQYGVCDPDCETYRWSRSRFCCTATFKRI